MSHEAIDASKFTNLLKSLSRKEIDLLNKIFYDVDEKKFFGEEFYLACMMKICVQSEKSDRDADFLE